MKTRSIISYNLFAVLFLIISFTCSGQDLLKAQWITLNYDTVQGYVKNKIINERLLSAVNLTKTERYRLSADSIREVIYGGKMIYWSTSIIYNGVRANIFLELIVEGEANLYKGSFKDLGKLFLIEIDQKIYMIGKTGINLFLKNILGDCFNDNIIKKDLYVESILKKAIIDYNRCARPESVINANPVNKFNKTFYVGSGLEYNHCHFNYSPKAYYDHGEYSRMSNFGAGITAGVNLSRRFFLQTELAYLKKDTYSDYVNIPPLSDPSISSKVEIKLTYLDFPLYAGYYLGTGKIKPFVAAGLNMGFLLSGGLFEEPYKLQGSAYGPPNVRFDGYDVGFLGLFGTLFEIKQNSALQVNFKYSYSDTDYYVALNAKTLGGYGTGSSNLNTIKHELSVTYLYQFR